MPAMPVSLLDWKPMPRNSLRGFAKVRVGKSLVLHDVTVHCANGRRWASPASKPQISKEGVVLKDDSGKMKYVPVVSWADKEAADSFSEGVIQAIEREHPGATGADA